MKQKFGILVDVLDKESYAKLKRLIRDIAISRKNLKYKGMYSVPITKRDGLLLQRFSITYMLYEGDVNELPAKHEYICTTSDKPGIDLYFI